jgi:hypothetical protein
MYVPPLPKTIRFPVEPNEDPELTCMVCKRKAPCELAIHIRYPGFHQWWGIHLMCAEEMEEAAKKIIRESEDKMYCGHTREEHRRMDPTWIAGACPVRRINCDKCGNKGQHYDSTEANYCDGKEGKL